MGFLFRGLLNLGKFAFFALLAYLVVFVILRATRYGLEYIGYEVKDFTSWMTRPFRDFIEWRKLRKDAK